MSQREVSRYRLYSSSVCGKVCSIEKSVDKEDPDEVWHLWQLSVKGQQISIILQYPLVIFVKASTLATAGQM